MAMRLGERLGFDALLLVVLAVMAAASLSFPPAARYLPLGVSVAGAALVCWCGVVDARNGLRGRDASLGRIRALVAGGVAGSAQPAAEEPAESRPGWYGPLGTFAWLAGFVAAIWYLGYLIATPIFALGYLLLARIRWTTAVAVTLGIWACAYGLLGLVLRY